MPFSFMSLLNNRYFQIATGLILLRGLFEIAIRMAVRDGEKREKQATKIRALEQDIEIKDNADEYVEAADAVRRNTVERVRDAEPMPDYHFRD